MQILPLILSHASRCSRPVLWFLASLGVAFSRYFFPLPCSGLSREGKEKKLKKCKRREEKKNRSTTKVERVCAVLLRGREKESEKKEARAV